jgi:hypothetical protein
MIDVHALLILRYYDRNKTQLPRFVQITTAPHAVLRYWSGVFDPTYTSTAATALGGTRLKS